MKTIKEKWLAFISQKKTKKIIKTSLISLSVLLGLFLVLIFLVLSIYGPWWKIWPAGIRSQIALNRLAVSIYNEPYCRTDCHLERQSYFVVLEKRLERSKKFRDKILNITLKEEENLAWRLELLALLAKNKAGLDFGLLQKALDSDQVNLNFQSALMHHFSSNLDSSIYQARLKMIASDTSSSESERRLALNSLEINPEDYLNSLSQSSNDDLTLSLLKSLAADPVRFKIDPNLLIPILENIIYSSSYYQSKRIALFIISDLLDYSFSDSLLKCLDEVISSSSTDKFTRYLAIDIANNYQEKKYETPLIRASDWNKYYQSK